MRALALSLGIAAAIAAAVFGTPATATATGRAHSVVQIVRDGKPVEAASGVTVTPRSGPAKTSIRRGDAIADGTRIDVPAHLQIIIESTGGKSRATLEPGASVTFVSTGAGEQIATNKGKTLFSVVPHSLDFFRVTSGESLAATVHGTIFSVEIKGSTYSYRCERGAVDITKRGFIQVGEAHKAVSIVDVISAASTAGAEYHPRANWFFARYKNFAEARKAYEADVTAARKRGDLNATSAALANLADVQASLGSYDDALATNGEAMAIFRAARDRYREAGAHRLSGYIKQERGDQTAAFHAYETALALDRRTGFSDGIAADLVKIGKLEINRGHFRAAEQLESEALSTFVRLHDVEGMASALSALSAIAGRNGKSDIALSDQLKSVTLYQQAGDLDGQSRELDNLGRYYLLHGDYPNAHKSYSAALSIAREIGDRSSVAYALANLGNVYAMQSKFVDAEAAQREALAIYHDMGAKSREADTMLSIAADFYRQGRADDAIAWYEKSRTLSHSLGDVRSETDVLLALVSLYTTQGRFAEAQAMGERALALRRTTEDPTGLAQTLGTVAAAYGMGGNAEVALRYRKEALLLFQKAHNREGEALARENLGVYYLRHEQYAQALPMLEAALVIYRKTDPDVSAQILENIGAVDLNLDRDTDAIAAYREAGSTYHRLGLAKKEADTISDEADLAAYRKRPADALDLYRRALTAHRAAANPAGEAHDLAGIGFALEAQGAYADAAQSMQQALAIAQRLGRRTDIATYQAALAKIASELATSPTPSTSPVPSPEPSHPAPG